MTEELNQRYAGTDNYGRPKADYLTTIAAMSDGKLQSECHSMIDQASRCNNPRADWHWMVDACYDEAKKRDEDASIYSRAYDTCYKECVG